MPTALISSLDYIVWVLPLTVYGLAFLIIGNEKARIRTAHWLSDVDGLKSSYFKRATEVIDYIEEKLGGSIGSARAFDLILRVAFCYPVTTYIFSWVFTGRVAQGIPASLPDNADFGSRMLVTAAIATSLYFFERASRKYGGEWLLSSFLSIAVLGAAGYVAGGSGTFIALAAVCVASIMTLLNSFRGGETRHKKYGVAIAFCGGGLGAFVCGLISWMVAPGGSFASGFMFVGVIAFISAGFSFSGGKSKEKRLLGLYLIAQWCIMVGAGGLIAYYVHPAKFDPAFIALFVMWGVLPFLNAPFDWVSIWISIALFKFTSRRNGEYLPVTIFFDFVIGLALLFILSATLMTVLGFYYYLATMKGHMPIVNPFEAVDRIRVDPGSPKSYWLYGMVSTTMWPTVAHAVIVTASAWIYLALPITRTLAKAIADVDESDLYNKSAVSFGLTIFLWCALASMALSGLFIFGTAWLSVPIVGESMIAAGQNAALLLARVIHSW